MKWYVKIDTAGVITLSGRGKTNNQTTLFYMLNDSQTGSEKWTTEGVTAWRKNNAVEVLVNIREEADGDYVLGTLPSNLRPPFDVYAVIPENLTGVKGTVSKWKVKSADLYTRVSLSTLEDNTGVIGTGKTNVRPEHIVLFDTCEYDIQLSILDHEKVPIANANAQYPWTRSGYYQLEKIPLPAGRTSLSLANSYSFGVTNYTQPGEYLVYLHLEGGGYEEDIPVTLTINTFYISSITVSYYSDTGSYNIADGDDASFSFVIKTGDNVPRDCDLSIYDGDRLIYHEENAISEGTNQTASSTTVWAEDFENEQPWTASDVGSKTLRFVLSYDDIEVGKSATVKVTNTPNGGA